MKTRILCICGPTAAGKSASVLALAKSTPIEIISMDSATIYKTMDIGTAKAGAEEQAQVPHHLLDIRDPLESYSAADFVADTLALIPAIQSRGNLPVIEGGTMMYYKALREGLHDLPKADAALRAEIEAEAAAIGWPAMHQKLSALDPETAARVAPNDSQRISRALEVMQLSGEPMSSLIAKQKTPLHDYDFITLSLEPVERSLLHQQIEKRFMQMLTMGFLDEVKNLYQRKDLHPDLPSIRCVGYRQLWDYLDGNCSYDEAVERGIAATRQLAKRQITWLRSQPERIQIDCFSENVPGQVLDTVRQLALID
ncbi:tRNA dimethylallyltransferase [Oligella sp. MSHR50489EDL]|uniref:tRNA (adenosine(37)-N6)-dimethylallyltransferase MiaA n=1 Tax=Oligella sp. MSHR50489EDL TaxID=3139409 RepID=UPI003D8132BA